MTVAMLSIIILGLVAMFDQTRRAFTSSMQQVDYLEGGRAAMTLIGNDLEQLAPSYQPNSGRNPSFENFYMDFPPPYTTIVQPLADPTDSRTNELQEFFFISRNNQYWNVIGYKINLNGQSAGIGTLYRFSSNNILANNSTNLPDFQFSFPTNDPSQSSSFSKVIDGVIDLRVMALDPNGVLLENTNSAGVISSNIYMTQAPAPGDQRFYRFRSNAVPAYVEVELGVLENRTLQRYYSMTNNLQVAGQYLTNHAGQVHIFRQRVPIRAVDLNAYTNLSPVLP